MESANIGIKKEASTHFESEEITQSKTRFLNMKRATRLRHKAVHDIKPVSLDYDKQEMI